MLLATSFADFKSLKTNNELKSAKDVANNIFEKYIKLRLNK